jgi:hypothetical protein
MGNPSPKGEGAGHSILPRHLSRRSSLFPVSDLPLLFVRIHQPYPSPRFVQERARFHAQDRRPNLVDGQRHGVEQGLMPVGPFGKA